jgi:hypothetical protein
MQVSVNDVSSKVRSAFDFSVDKFPLFGPENMRTDQYGLFRSDTGYIEGVKSISGRYVPHTTDDVCALVEAASEAFDGEIECKTHFAKGHYVSVAPSDADRVSIYGAADNIFPRIMIRGGFDGKGFKATMGYYRDACRNLAMLRQVSGCTESIRHTSGLRSQMDSLIAKFEELKNGWENLVDIAHQMQSREVNLADFVNETFADRRPSVEEVVLADTGRAVRGVTTWTKMTEAIMSRVIDERSATGRDAFNTGEPKIVSAWEAFNAVQGYVQHDAQSKTGFKSEFSRILRAANDKHVSIAEGLALSA